MVRRGENPTTPTVREEPISDVTPAIKGPVVLSPAVRKDAGIEVYLGSGMALGFAHQGVIKSLHDWKIKVLKIHAQEIGALIAVAYAEKLNLNRMDWTLSKFPENSFTNKTSGLLFKGIESVGTRLEKRLADTFSSLKEADLTVPVVVEGVPESGIALWEKIRVSLSHPPLLPSYKEMTKKDETTDFSEAGKNSKNKMIVVNIQSSSETKILQNIPGVLLVLQIGIPNFSDDDFKRRSQAAYYGRSQVEKLKKEVFTFLNTEDFR